MSSILKVDQIQLADGNAASTADLGLTTSMPTGSVLQVVNGRTNTNFNTQSTSYTDTYLYASITPSSASSKILILVDQAGFCAAGTGDYQIFYNICRGSTVINENRVQYSYASDWQYAANNCKYLDSPNTTSSVTYKTQVKTASGVNPTIYMNWDSSSYSNIILMEIAG